MCSPIAAGKVRPQLNGKPCARVVRDRVRRLNGSGRTFFRRGPERVSGRTFEILSEHRNERTGMFEGFTRLSQSFF